MIHYVFPEHETPSVEHVLDSLPSYGYKHPRDTGLPYGVVDIWDNGPLVEPHSLREFFNFVNLSRHLQQE